jgi:predicted flavoprotein YhiN
MQKTVEADMLCVGGAVAGLMASIRASELNGRIVGVEKGNDTARKNDGYDF